MTRAEALAALIAAVQAGTWTNAQIRDAFPVPHERFLFGQASVDNLNSVARMERDLRARGWLSFVEGNGDGAFYAELQRDGRKVHGRSTSEARARLLAVLRALLHEAEAP